MTTPVIHARGLTHRFGAVTALDRVDLTVGAGEIYGFLGRNGAGKTTLIRALLGLISPTAGDVAVFGTPVRGGHTQATLWAAVGYLVEGPGLYPTLTVAEHLWIAARYRRLRPSAVEAVVDRLDLGRFTRVRARALSLGNRQRLGLALALVHRPRLLVLDEPVNGLDPAGVVEIRHLLRELADDGVTVFMSTHIIGEVARLADRVGVIHAGRLVEELAGTHVAAAGQERLVATFTSPELASLGERALRDAGIEAHATAASLESTAALALAHPDRVVTRLVQAGAAPTSLNVRREDLEEYFLRRTEGSAA